MNNFYNPYNPYTAYGYNSMAQNQPQNYTNPYQNLYPNQYQNQTLNQSQYQSNQQNTYVFVNGIEGAKAYQVAPNQTMMLLDSEKPLIYKKVSDQFGKSSIQFYKMIETTEEELKHVEVAPSEDTTALKKEVASLSEKINAIYNALEGLNIKDGENNA